MHAVLLSLAVLVADPDRAAVIRQSLEMARAERLAELARAEAQAADQVKTLQRAKAGREPIVAAKAEAARLKKERQALAAGSALPVPDLPEKCALHTVGHIREKGALVREILSPDLMIVAVDFERRGGAVVGNTFVPEVTFEPRLFLLRLNTAGHSPNKGISVDAPLLCVGFELIEHRGVNHNLAVLEPIPAEQLPKNAE